MLTKRLIDHAEYDGKARSRCVLWDDEVIGLGLRVYPPRGESRARKTFVLSYRIGSRKRLLTLGDYGGSLTLDQARKEARKQLYAVEHQSRDPLSEKRQERAAQTVRELIKVYMERHAKATKRSWREDQRILDKDVGPRIGHLKIREVKRADVIDIIDRVNDRGAVTAVRTFAITRKMFNFGIQRGLLEHSPCYRIATPAQAASRDRVLSADEIKTLVATLSDTRPRGPNDDELWPSVAVRLGIHLLLLTAQRRGEVAGARWEQFDLEAGYWTLPPQSTKNERPHRVPLSADALAILWRLKSLSADSPFVLPGRRNDASINAHSITRAFDRMRKVTKLADATVHDLRRTAASGMAEAGTQRLVISKILNHTDRSVTAIYERFEYQKEMLIALEGWAQHVREIVDGSRISKVVAFPRRTQV